MKTLIEAIAERRAEIENEIAAEARARAVEEKRWDEIEATHLRMFLDELQAVHDFFVRELEWQIGCLRHLSDGRKYEFNIAFKVKRGHGKASIWGKAVYLVADTVWTFIDGNGRAGTIDQIIWYVLQASGSPSFENSLIEAASAIAPHSWTEEDRAEDAHLESAIEERTKSSEE